LAQSLCWGSCLTAGPDRWQPHCPEILIPWGQKGTIQAGSTCSMTSFLLFSLVSLLECKFLAHRQGSCLVDLSSPAPSTELVHIKYYTYFVFCFVHVHIPTGKPHLVRPPVLLT
jgi:hypothetical protein